MKETFKAATSRLLGDLARAGWSVESSLKVPRADSPDGETTLWFEPQSVYMAFGSRHARAQRSGARSLWLDRRGATFEQFLGHVHRAIEIEHRGTR